MNSSQQTVAVLFGGRSVEHEVSIITGHQVMDALEQAGYRVLPIFISKQGAWYAGAPLHNLRLYSKDPLPLSRKDGVFRVSLSPDRTVRELVVHPEYRGGVFSKDPVLWAEVFFPTIHSSFGEDGTLQGVFEMADVPYVGSGVAASSIAIDKALTKQIARSAGIPVLECAVVTRNDWAVNPNDFISKVSQSPGFPLVVKPVSLGSSIGVGVVANEAELRDALDLALAIDERALVERALSDFIEINCSILGPTGRASVCEQPVPVKGILTFDDKYKRGGSKKTGKASGAAQGMAALDRLIPAPISKDRSDRVQELARQMFQAIGGAGVARMDFLHDNRDDQLYLNEVNTLPGSVAYYLWEASGLMFDSLVRELVNEAVARHRAKTSTQFSFAANLLSARS